MKESSIVIWLSKKQFDYYRQRQKLLWELSGMGLNFCIDESNNIKGVD